MKGRPETKLRYVVCSVTRNLLQVILAFVHCDRMGRRLSSTSASFAVLRAKPPAGRLDRTLAAGEYTSQCGFTVLEAVVAVAIASLVLTALLSAEMGAYRAARRIKLQQAALPRAQTHLDHVASDGKIEEGSSSGVYDNGMRWTLSVRALAKGDGAAAALLPFWVTLATYDSWGKPLLQLDTAKMARSAK